MSHWFDAIRKFISLSWGNGYKWKIGFKIPLIWYNDDRKLHKRIPPEKSGGNEK